MWPSRSAVVYKRTRLAGTGITEGAFRKTLASQQKTDEPSRQLLLPCDDSRRQKPDVVVSKPADQLPEVRQILIMFLCRRQGDKSKYHKARATCARRSRHRKKESQCAGKETRGPTRESLPLVRIEKAGNGVRRPAGGSRIPKWQENDGATIGRVWARGHCKAGQ